jgi:integrase/recombinase XerC
VAAARLQPNPSTSPDTGLPLHASTREPRLFGVAGCVARGVAAGTDVLPELPPSHRSCPSPRGSPSAAQVGRHRQNRKTPCRDLAILSVLCGAGMLRAELTHLDLSHVEGAQLMVIGKGSKWRQAHLGLEAVAALASWLAVRRSAPGALFLPSHRSGSLRPGRLSIEAVARVISRRTVVAGVGMLRPHDLRGALATRLLKTGVDVLLVQRILGYRSVATTQIYDCRIDSAAHTAAIQ